MSNPCSNLTAAVTFFSSSTEINTVCCVDLTQKSSSDAGTPHCVELTQQVFYCVVDVFSYFQDLSVFSLTCCDVEW